MKIAITGYNGFVGQYLRNYFASKGLEIIPIERKLLYGDLHALTSLIEESNIVIHLAGATLNKYWTKKYMQKIYNSRILTTNQLVKAISLCKNRPQVLISTSAIGIYDNKHSHDENSRYLAGTFLGKVCKDWELAALNAENFGVDVYILRFGIVLGLNGGMIKKMLPLFKIGLGGSIGNGNQALSFIHIDDLVRIYDAIISGQLKKGIYNAVSPYPTTNKQFSKQMAHILKRPLFFAIPKFVFRILFGKGAELLTQGQLVYPHSLLEQGFKFKYETIDSALHAILKPQK
ncbi:MAG: TIGR01777 family protein [Bacteroidales bacterium]|nr:TIGR01777 family protein [Bacteroidales bacterium]